MCNEISPIMEFLISVAFVVFIFTIYAIIAYGNGRKHKKEVAMKKKLKDELCHVVIDPMMSDLFSEDNIPFNTIEVIYIRSKKYEDRVNLSIYARYELFGSDLDHDYRKSYTHHHPSNIYNIISNIYENSMDTSYINGRNSVADKYAELKLKEYVDVLNAKRMEDNMKRTEYEKYVNQIYQ